MKKLAETTKPASNLKQTSRPSSRTSIKTAPPPSTLKFSLQKKVITNQKRFTSCLLVHVPNKYQLITAGGNSLTLWDTKTFTAISFLAFDNFEINNLCYLEHASLLLVSSWKSRELRLCSLKNGTLKMYSRKFLEFHPMGSISLSLNDIVCTASLDKRLLFWNSRSGQKYFRPAIPNGLEIRAITSIERRACVGLGCKDGTILIFNYLKKQVMLSYQLPFKLIIIMDLFVPFMAYNSSLGLLFVGSCNSNIEVLKIVEKQGKQHFVPVPHKLGQEGVRGLYSFDKEKLIMTVHDNQFLRLWNAEKLQTGEAIPAKVSQAYCFSLDQKINQLAVADFQAAAFSVLSYQ